MTLNEEIELEKAIDNVCWALVCGNFGFALKCDGTIGPLEEIAIFSFLKADPRKKEREMIAVLKALQENGFGTELLPFTGVIDGKIKKAAFSFLSSGFKNKLNEKKD